MKKIFTLLALLAASSLLAQITIEGKITDKETGKPLPYANVQIENTFRGTITNSEGEFTISMKEVPGKLKIRYIGYESETININASTRRLKIELTPQVVVLRQIVVTGEDPAVRIMRKVIENKQRWSKLINTYKAEAYTRAALRNDSAIVSISESTSEVYWHRDKGTREVVKSRQETSNITSDNNFAFAGQIPNLYDDDIEFMEFKIVGPTHPKALKYYKFKIIDERRIDDKVVVDISIEPKNKLQPTFVGRISIQLNDYALIDIDVKPNQAMLFPVPIQKLDLHFRQQFSNFGKKFWLPVDVRIQGGIKIGMTGLQFPTMNYNQVSRLTDYLINIQMPDSLFEFGGTTQVDSASVAGDSLLMEESLRIPLTEEESEAYSSLDSTMTLDKAFKPTGFLAKFARIEVNRGDSENDSTQNRSGKFTRFLSKFTPDIKYNRVDGLHAGLSVAPRLPGKLRLRLKGAYKTGLKRWAWGGSLNYREGVSRGLSGGIEYFNGSKPVQPSVNYASIFNSLNFLMGQPDYFDYFWNESWAAKLSWGFRLLTRGKIELGLRSETHTSLGMTTDWTLFDKNRVHRENPSIEDGQLKTITAAVTLGDEFAPWGFIGFNRLRIEVEHSNPDFLPSDFSYTTARVMLDGRIPTFLTRRFLPNTLDFRIVGGVSDGDVPVQRQGSMDVRMGMFTPFGTFRTLRHRPVTGESYAGIFWEHNFRTVPFEILGLRKIAEKGISIILHGASGRTWISDRKRAAFTWNGLDDWHHEIGLSISGIMDIFRVDVTKPVNKSGWYFGLSAARVF